MHHVAVLHDVFLAFRRHVARGLRALFAAIGDVRGVVYDFGADETFFEICVNDARSLRGGRADGDGPRADFLFAGREITLK